MATHLITGAGSGIGGSVARSLWERGDDLVLLARDMARGRDLVDLFPGSRAIVADLADPSGIAATLEGQDLPATLDSLLHSAGVVDLGTVGVMSADLWRATIDVNLLAPAELTRLCLPALRAGRGHVVFLNSGAGLSAHPSWAAYAASKHGLRALAESLRAEEKHAGVRVTSVYAGRVATPMQQKVHAQEGKPYDAADWIAPASVASTILATLDLSRDAEVTDVTLRPGP